jgi:hypothetical protein
VMTPPAVLQTRSTAALVAGTERNLRATLRLVVVVAPQCFSNESKTTSSVRRFSATQSASARSGAIASANKQPMSHTLPVHCPIASADKTCPASIQERVWSKSPCGDASVRYHVTRRLFLCIHDTHQTAIRIERTPKPAPTRFQAL